MLNRLNNILMETIHYNNELKTIECIAQENRNNLEIIHTILRKQYHAELNLNKKIGAEVFGELEENGEDKMVRESN